MNAVEIEESISELAEQPFDTDEFPYAFLGAFGNRQTTIKRLRSGSSNPSDIDGAVLQRNNIHLAACPPGGVADAFDELRASPATAAAKAKFILATDGDELEAEDLNTGETIACDYADFPDHFGFFLPLAGITTVEAIRNNPIDIKATGRLNKLYVELLKENEDWAADDRRHDMNQFMARLIFCFFAEDTEIFPDEGAFTATVRRMSDPRTGNAQAIIAELFRAMDTKDEDRATGDFPRWADAFPYVNGGLFAGLKEVPKFSSIARTYLLRAGDLDWKAINPDIFGSMIQAVADDDQRGTLGMHYTSVPNILKVLNPLFLDDLREQLEVAGDNPRKLLNLRKRIAKIRVFDPACGSGNFLVIAYKEMRAIEAKINERRRDPERRTEIPLTNFRGIELCDFPAEIARLALIIAEYQCDMLHRGQKKALAGFLPLDAMNWITCGNALRLDWLSVCPPTGTGVKHRADDLFQSPLDQAQVDFENEGGETFICGNPPYRGSTWQSREQKDDLKPIFERRTKKWKSLDYVTGWFMKAADYGTHTTSVAAFVSTNSICQGQQVPILWPLIFLMEQEITFAHTSFKWSNLAKHNAGVTVVIVGITNRPDRDRTLFSLAENGATVARVADTVNAYLAPGTNVIVQKRSSPLTFLPRMDFGNKPVDGGNLLLDEDEVAALSLSPNQADRFVRRICGSAEFIRGLHRYCLWIEDRHLDAASAIGPIRERIEGVRAMRLASSKAPTRRAAAWPHRFGEVRQSADERTIVVPRVSSENRPYLPVGLLSADIIVSDRNFALYDAPLWNMALIASRLHWVWIGTVCVRLRTDFSYSNTLGWNTFPVPQLTGKNKADLTRCAEDILLAREAHFPATIAHLYDPNKMPENLRHAHDRNDEVLERIYIGRRFKNDTERLEQLFDLYTKMTAAAAKPEATAGRA